MSSMLPTPNLVSHTRAYPLEFGGQVIYYFILSWFALTHFSQSIGICQGTILCLAVVWTDKIIIARTFPEKLPKLAVFEVRGIRIL